MKSNSEYEIIDDAISVSDFYHIKNSMMNTPSFPWFFQKAITFDDKFDPNYFYYMTHVFYENHQPNSENFSFLSPILNKINPFSIQRIKGNFYPNQNIFHEHQMHIDNHSTLGAIFYLNDNNGYTKLKLDNGDHVKIESIENRLLLFDSRKEHCSTNCTDDFGRFNINFNFYY